MKPLIQGAALLLVALASAARRSVYVKRASGHSGSRWIAVNLAASNLSTFFQDGGLCAGRCCLPTGAPQATPARRLDALAALYDAGCRCMFARDARAGAGFGNERCMTCGKGGPRPRQIRANETGCQWGEYCRGACAAEAPAACAGVATVGAIPDDPADDYHDKCDGKRSWCLNKAVARRAWHADLKRRIPDLAVVSWDRDNSVKHALSYLKHNHHFDCASPFLANHGHRDEASLEARAAPRSFLYVHPTRLLLKAAEKALGRLALKLELKSVDVSYAAHYEAFQVDEAGEMARLLGALGVPVPDAWATDELVKLTPEDLRDLLVNFDELNATLAPWPCLRAMLGSAAPERFAPCAETELPSPREVAALRVPSMSASAAVVLPCDGGRRAAKLPRHVKADPDALCARAAAMGRALHGSPRAEVCVLP